MFSRANTTSMGIAKPVFPIPPVLMESDEPVVRIAERGPRIALNLEHAGALSGDQPDLVGLEVDWHLREGRIG